MNTKGCVLFLSQLFCLAISSPAQSLVRFDQARYDISPGETFKAQVLITPAPAAGLYSYGVQLAFPPVNAQIAALSSISLPSLLDFDGVRGAGAPKVLAGGSAAVKGTVDFALSPIQPYSDSLVATFNVTDLAPGPYELRLAPFNTLGPTEEIFVDGSGSALDAQLTFGTALVNYRPVVWITGPTNGADFISPPSIPISAQASDPDGTVTNVSFFDGTNQLGAVASAPFLVNWGNPPPGIHVLTAVATDNLGATAASSNVIISVRSNSPPVLALIPDKTVVAGTLLSFTATATDPDAPPQTLTFSLDPGTPTGVSITADGLFTWTPTTSQAPSTNSVTVRVTDNGLPPLSDSRSFKIFVNQPPHPTESYAIFAGASGFANKSRVVDVSGSKSSVNGKIHSNSDINVGGNKHIFSNAPVEFVTGIDPAPDFKGKVTLINSPILQSTVKPYPVDYVLASFAPGSSAAAAAQAAGKYFPLAGDSDLQGYITKGVLREGLYYVQGKVHLSGDVLQGKVTIVATDEIQVSGSHSQYESFVQNLLLFSGQSGKNYQDDAIKISGNSHKFGGLVFTPNGGLQVSGSDNQFLGGLVGLGVDLSGSGLQISASDLVVRPSLAASLARSPLPPVVQVRHGKGLAISFSTVSGRIYCVEYSDSITRPAWQLLTSLTGDGNVATIPISGIPAQRYYRLRLP